MTDSLNLSNISRTEVFSIIEFLFESLERTKKKTTITFFKTSPVKISMYGRGKEGKFYKDLLEGGIEENTARWISKNGRTAR